jgi:hypothetical protein
MEAFAIVLYRAAGIIAAPVFCLVLAKGGRQFPQSTSIGFWLAAVFVSSFCIEITLAATIGILETRALIGPAYFLMHVLLTFSAAPALACLLLLGRHRIMGGWAAAAIVSWLVGAGAIFYQYNVAETLYGMDGSGGPYQLPW